MISQGASKVNISFIIPGKREKEVIQALHSCFFEDECIVPVRSPFEDLGVGKSVGTGPAAQPAV